jgi:iron complex transport system ATP-binding protein
MVTHHVEEIPPGFTHAMLLADGAIQVSGPIAEVITGENLTDTFGLELVVSTSETGRYAARAAS